MSNIQKLIEFAANGEKKTDELNLIEGFPGTLKPLRQWFNYLFNTITVKINEVIDTLEGEKSLRQDTDNALQLNINQEQMWRSDADGWLQQQIESEQANRISADNVLQQNINQEQAWRTDAYNGLQQQIWQVDGWRADADAGLQQQINDLTERKLNKTGGTVDGDLTVTQKTTTKQLFVQHNNGLNMRIEVANYGILGLSKRIEFVTDANNYTFDKPVFAPNLEFSSWQDDNGYIVFPNGVIMQWGKSEGSDGHYVGFPMPFPNQLFMVQTTDKAGSNRVGYNAASTTGFNMTTNVGSMSFSWFAIGR